MRLHFHGEYNLQQNVCSDMGFYTNRKHATLVHLNDAAADDEATILYRLLGHQCDVLISVQPLRTGYCRDLDGDVSWNVFLIRFWFGA